MNNKITKIFDDGDGYKCPACGVAATIITKTVPISDCIIRIRKCLVCGFKHKTSEVSIGKNITYYMGINSGRVSVKEVA